MKAVLATALAGVGVMVGIFVLFAWSIGGTKQPIEREQKKPIKREQERAVAAAQHIALSCGWAFKSLDPEIAFSRCRVDDLDRLKEAVWLVRFIRIGRPRRSACVGVDLRRFRVLDVDGRLLAADSGGPEPPLPGEGRWRASCSRLIA